MPLKLLSLFSRTPSLIWCLLVWFSLFIRLSSSLSAGCPFPGVEFEGYCYGMVPRALMYSKYELWDLWTSDYPSYDLHEHAAWYCANVWLGGGGAGNLASVHSQAEVDFLQTTLWNIELDNGGGHWEYVNDRNHFYPFDTLSHANVTDQILGECCWIGLRADRNFLDPKGKCELKWTDGTPVDFDPFDIIQLQQHSQIEYFCDQEIVAASGEGDEDQSSKERSFDGCYCLPLGNFTDEGLRNITGLTGEWESRRCRFFNDLRLRQFFCKREMNHPRIVYLMSLQYLIPALFGLAMLIPFVMLGIVICIAWCVAVKCPEKARTWDCCDGYGCFDISRGREPDKSILRKTTRPASFSMALFQWILCFVALLVSMICLWIAIPANRSWILSDYSDNVYGENGRLSSPTKTRFLSGAVVTTVFLPLFFLLPCCCVCFSYLVTECEHDEIDNKEEIDYRKPIVCLVAVCFPILWPYYCCCIQYSPKKGWKLGLERADELRKERLEELRGLGEESLSLFHDGKDVKEFRRAVLMAKWPGLDGGQRKNGEENQEIRLQAILDNLELLHDVKVMLSLGIVAGEGGTSVFNEERNSSEEEEEGEVVVEYYDESEECDEEGVYELVEIEIIEEEEEGADHQMIKKEEVISPRRRRLTDRHLLLTTFRTFKSFLILSSDVGGAQKLKSFTVSLDRFVGHQGLVITEEFFNRFFFGAIPPAELLFEHEAMFDLYAILRALGLRNHMQYLCSLVESAKNLDADVIFQLLRACHDRFEDPVDDPTRPVSEFKCGLTSALFERIRALDSSPRRKRAISVHSEDPLNVRSAWLSSVGLDLIRSSDVVVTAEDLPALKEKAARMKPPKHARAIMSTCNIFLADPDLFEQFTTSLPSVQLDTKPFQNMFLQSGIDGPDSPLIGAHVEVLFASYDCFRLMLSFSERVEFRNRRIVVMEFLTTNAIRALVEFSYTGELSFDEIARPPPVFPSIGEMFLLLHFADKYAADALRRCVVRCLKRVRTGRPGFLDAIRSEGLVISEPSGSRDEILAYWANSRGADEEVNISSIWEALSQSRMDDLEAQIQEVVEEKVALALFAQIAGK